jgi:hypothetical protein
MVRERERERGRGRERERERERECEEHLSLLYTWSAEVLCRGG